MGYKITRIFLRKPVTAFLVMLSIIFFGFVSVSSFKYELMPELSMPMYAVATVYPGAQPEDIDELVTKKLEEECYNLQGVKSLQCSSMENVSIVAIQYNYGQNMDKAYNDLKKAVDSVKNKFDDSVQEPNIIEMDVNSQPVVKLAVSNRNGEDIYNYVTGTMVKELEKISQVSSIDVTGGRENYIKIEVKPEMMTRYNLSMDTLKNIVANADFSFPGGVVNVGNRELSFTSAVEYDTVEALKTIPIITGNKTTLYLEDVANVYQAKKEATSLGRYDGNDCIIVSITKTQSASTIALSNNVNRVINRLCSDNEDLVVTVVEDNAENISSSLKNVVETMVIAIILSMFIIWIFFGDLKASFIVGTSIPFSILTAFVCMYACGFSLNIITLSALVLGVGMMVDNSIVVLEACFRASDEYQGEKEAYYYCKASLKASNTIGGSVFGSTLTTVVVFAPLGFISGMSGQFFKPLGFTIVFCMLASYVSSVSVVPLLYVLLKPQEREEAPAAGLIRILQEKYRGFLPKLLNRKKLTVLCSILFLIISFVLAGTLKTELVAESDEGKIKIDITTKPGLTLEARDEIYKEFEKFLLEKEEVEHYILSNSAGSMSMSGNSGQSLIAYLIDEKERGKTTDEVVHEWKQELANVTNCTINIDSYSSGGTGGFSSGVTDEKLEILIQSNEYENLKEANDRVVKMLEQRKDCGNVTSTLDNSAPLVKAEIDPILAAAEGFTPAAVGGLLNTMLSGIEVMEKTIDGDTQSVYIEYDEIEYDTVSKVENIPLTSASGNKTTLNDIANIGYHDNPSTIPKYNRKYRSTITAHLNEFATPNTKKEIDETIVEPIYNKYIEKATSSYDEMMVEEFTSLFTAVFIAAFLVFVVMASQFESIKYSFMIMGTVLFSFSGAILAIWLTDLKLSMVVILGFLMLIGTAVNNGILYIDTVNQFIEEGKDTRTALIEAGAIRLRPIMMTTFTTVVSMIPMSLAYGDNGEMLQGLAVANIGGLIISTFMALFVLPILYAVFTKNNHKKKNLETLAPKARDSIIDYEEDMRLIAIANAERRRNEKNKKSQNI